MGGFTCYGLVERSDVCLRENTLPIAISLDCTLTRPVAKDRPITYDDANCRPAGSWTGFAPSRRSGSGERRLTRVRQRMENDMRVVLLCGGFGTRQREHSDTIPKPLVNICCQPIL